MTWSQWSKWRWVSIDREFDKLGCPGSTGWNQEITWKHGTSTWGGIPPVPIGLGGNGCSTNRGASSGVQEPFKQEFPWFLFSWCVAHCLELALKDALSSYYFKEVDEVLLRLYYMYENNPKKTSGLYDIHLAYKRTFPSLEGSAKPKRASVTGWICHCQR